VTVNPGAAAARDAAGLVRAVGDAAGAPGFPEVAVPEHASADDSAIAHSPAEMAIRRLIGLPRQVAWIKSANYAGRGPPGVTFSPGSKPLPFGMGKAFFPNGCVLLVVAPGQVFLATPPEKLC
jgi:hypothetical protein